MKIELNIDDDFIKELSFGRHQSDDENYEAVALGIQRAAEQELEDINFIELAENAINEKQNREN